MNLYALIFPKYIPFTLMQLQATVSLIIQITERAENFHRLMMKTMCYCEREREKCENKREY